MKNIYLRIFIELEKDLVSKTYIPGKYNIFLIHDPKLRLIMSQELHDKVINHLVSKYFLTDVFDSSFIDTNVATRLERGTHYGIKMLTKYLNEMKENNIYYLKFDIKKYFYNIDHSVVKELINRKIKDKNVLNIIYKIIESTDLEYINEKITKLKENEINRIKSLNITNKEEKIEELKSIPLYEKGKGFPIGNMSSQIIATLYLNDIDHFIKEKLKIKHYIRYMDDGILLSSDKNYLKYCLYEIEKDLRKYKLEFNKKKTFIGNIKNGLDFLGFRYYIDNGKVIRKLRNRTKKRFKKNINSNNIASYKGLLKWEHCNNLIYKYMKKYN